MLANLERVIEVFVHEFDGLSFSQSHHLLSKYLPPLLLTTITLEYYYLDEQAQALFGGVLVTNISIIRGVEEGVVTETVEKCRWVLIFDGALRSRTRRYLLKIYVDTIEDTYGDSSEEQTGWREGCLNFTLIKRLGKLQYYKSRRKSYDN